MNVSHRIEFGDFQTPIELAREICAYLIDLHIDPDHIIEPTCGTGAFVLAAAEAFPTAQIIGCEINPTHLQTLTAAISTHTGQTKIETHHADFFSHGWPQLLDSLPGELLVIGNLPWVTNAAMGGIGGSNLPDKSNFLGFSGFDAISGKANFDISEWMLLRILDWFSKRTGTLALLVKTAVARKVLAHAERQRLPVVSASTTTINTRRHFSAAVDSCLLQMTFAPVSRHAPLEYTVFENFSDRRGHRIGHRRGLPVADLDDFDGASRLFGESPQKWRSGIKHDAAAIMELTRTAKGYENGLGETQALENLLLFPLMKGSDIGSGKAWREKFVIVTQRAVGVPTNAIRNLAPQTWLYLEKHGSRLDARASTIYRKNPRFSIFGVGDYAFRPWRIAICSLYKKLDFRLISPIEGKPVMFDDTVYYLSFDSQDAAEHVLSLLEAEEARRFLSSLIFWDEKRPIKTGILNLFDWSTLEQATLL